jgi:hypothetical protein
MRCKICGTDLANDLFAYVTSKPTCCICTVNYVGGDFSPERIARVRSLLGLTEGEYLQQDNAAEAARILRPDARRE